MPVPPTGGDAGATGDAGTMSASGGGATTLQTSGADSGTGGDSATGPADSTGPGVVDTDSGAATDSGGTSQGADSGSSGGGMGSGTDSGGVVGTDSGGSTGGAPITLGFACTMDTDCDQAAGEECCTANQCADTCMIPCGGPQDCPMGMGCEHSYCLFECADNDADCAMWPGYTCQHPQGGVNTLCEAD